MKNSYSIVLLCLLLSRCTTAAKNDLNALNTYWEIDRVRLSDGTEKQYNFNQNIDFFEHDGQQGIRKKVQPNLDGTFHTTRIIETFRLIEAEDSTSIVYKTPYATWTETIIIINRKQLVIKNDAGALYYYKPYQKIIL